MPSEPSFSPIPVATLDSLVNVHAAYLSLMQFAPNAPEQNLGGSLLYAGELDEPGRTCAVAANIAGAATLAASADSAVLRKSQRDGVIDFLVNSLDEALRILKNELRKRQPVAVAVSKTGVEIEEEMLERGVLPDLVMRQPTSELAGRKEFLTQGAKLVAIQSHETGKCLCVWAAPPEYSQNLAAFEVVLADQLLPDDHLNRRWLRLSPRYLGTDARRIRSITCDESTVEILSAKIGRPALLTI